MNDTWTLTINLLPLYYLFYILLRTVWFLYAGLIPAIVGKKETNIRIYHILLIILDIPAIILFFTISLLITLFSIPIMPLRKMKRREQFEDN